MKPTKPMNRRAFLGGALKLAAAVGLATLPQPVELPQSAKQAAMPIGAGRRSLYTLGNLGTSMKLPQKERGLAAWNDDNGRLYIMETPSFLMVPLGMEQTARAIIESTGERQGSLS